MRAELTRTPGCASNFSYEIYSHLQMDPVHAETRTASLAAVAAQSDRGVHHLLDNMVEGHRVQYEYTVTTLTLTLTLTLAPINQCFGEPSSSRKQCASTIVSSQW